jgi:hypothetical protein
MAVPVMYYESHKRPTGTSFKAGPTPDFSGWCIEFYCESDLTVCVERYLDELEAHLGKKGD